MTPDRGRRSTPLEPSRAATGRLTGFVWRTVAAFFERQLTFNSRLVDHVNRSVPVDRARIAIRPEQYGETRVA